jgi:hypothetical protein
MNVIQVMPKFIARDCTLEKNTLGSRRIEMSSVIACVSEMGTIILSGNKTSQAQPISLIIFWGKLP